MFWLGGCVGWFVIFSIISGALAKYYLWVCVVSFSYCFLNDAVRVKVSGGVIIFFALAKVFINKYFF